MLRVLINDKSDGIISLLDEYKNNVSAYFDIVFDKSWLSDDFVKRMIYEIDNTIVNPDGTLYNSVLGGIVSSQLSSGVKGLILLYKENCKINGDRLGDNCWGLVMEIARLKDIDIVLRHIPQLTDDFEAYLINDSIIVNKQDYIFAFVRKVG